jgi:pimeloyl-ACP methyl ester carboxylesterase
MMNVSDSREGLAVEEEGLQDGPPVLFLHGFMSSNLQWQPNRAALATKLRLLLVEQPGHGRSPGPDDPAAYRAETVLQQLDRVRSDRGIERLWLVGQSLGGAIAIRYALAYPERVAGLVFTNSRAVFGLVGKQGEQHDPDGPPPEYTRDKVRQMPYHPRNAKRLPPELQAKMIEVADAMPLTVFRYLRSGGPWQSTDDLHRLSVPTLLINGRFEKAFQPCVDQAAASVPDLEVVSLDGGHSVNIDQPELFNEAVVSFVARTAAS